MARLAIPSGWAGALIRQRGPLRTYQWLWLLLCAAGSLIVAGPRILSQPVIYTSTAAATFDTRRYGGLFTSGQPNGEYAAVERIAIDLLRASQDGISPRYPGLGGPTLGVRYEPQPGGSVRVVAVAASPAESRRLADDAAEALARSVRAAGGREIFRILTGSYLYSTLVAGQTTADPFQQQLRTIYLTSAFPLNRPPDPDARQITAGQLAPEERSDLARALEVRDVELSRRDLPALQGRIAAAGLDCRANRRDLGERADALCLEEQRLIDGLAAIRGGLGLLNTPFDPARESSAYLSAQAAPGDEIPRHTGPLLALAALVGLVLGGVGVVVDRSAGAMSKLRELWSYRELIRNLVLRDLRVRYKGSALGYLWTQLAPLLMMGVFWFVFSFVQPQQIAMFPVFLIVGLLPWNFCNEAIASGARSVIDNANLIKKVFFPREVLPLVSVFSSLVNYLLSLPMMFLVMAIVQLLYPPLRDQGRLFNFAPTVAYLPVLIVIQALFLAGVALFFSALAVHFRDFVHLIGIMLQFWFFLTPVVYALDVLNISVGGVALAQVVRWLNPMASLIEFYREVLYGNTVFGSQVPTPGLPALTSVLRVLVTALVVLTIGYWFFQRRSGQFGEEI
jgi:lipopolysaccharide transport system permease protein